MQWNNSKVYNQVTKIPETILSCYLLVYSDISTKITQVFQRPVLKIIINYYTSRKYFYSVCSISL